MVAERLCHVVEPAHLLGREHDIHARHVFFEVIYVDCSGNRRPIVALGEQPREGKLSERASHFGSNFLDIAQHAQVVLERAVDKPRICETPIIGIEGIKIANTAGEHSTAHRRVRYETNSELAHKIEEVIQWQPGKSGGALEGTPNEDQRFKYIKYDVS